MEEQIPAHKKFVLSWGNKNRLSCRIYRQLLQICTDKKVDVIVLHHHNWFLQRLMLKIRRRLPDIRYVFMIHNCYDKQMELGSRPGVKTIRYHYLKKTLSAVDCIFAVSHAGLQSFQNAFPGISQEKCRVIYNGIPQSYLEAGRDHKLHLHEVLRILYIGRLDPVKGLDLAIRALPLVRGEQKIILTIVGAGSHELELRRIASQVATPERRVEFAGAHLDKEKYWQDADVFVYPSVCEEIFGISLVEAMAYGLPCIANPVGGIPEIIWDGKNGYFTAEKSPQAIADCLNRVLQAYENRSIEEIAENAKQTAARFSIVSTCAQMEKAYRDLLDTAESASV